MKKIDELDDKSKKDLKEKNKNIRELEKKN